MPRPDPILWSIDVRIGLDLAVGVGQPYLPSRDRRKEGCFSKESRTAVGQVASTMPSPYSALGTHLVSIRHHSSRWWAHSYPHCTDGEGSSDRLSTLPASHTQRVVDKERGLFCTGQTLVRDTTVSDLQHGVRIWLIRPSEWKGRDDGDTFIAGVSDGEFGTICIPSSVVYLVLLVSIHWGCVVQTQESDCQVP